MFKLAWARIWALPSHFFWGLAATVAVLSAFVVVTSLRSLMAWFKPKAESDPESGELEMTAENTEKDSTPNLESDPESGGLKMTADKLAASFMQLYAQAIKNRKNRGSAEEAQSEEARCLGVRKCEYAQLQKLWRELGQINWAELKKLDNSLTQQNVISGLLLVDFMSPHVDLQKQIKLVSYLKGQKLADLALFLIWVLQSDPQESIGSCRKTLYRAQLYYNDLTDTEASLREWFMSWCKPGQGINIEEVLRLRIMDECLKGILVSSLVSKDTEGEIRKAVETLKGAIDTNDEPTLMETLRATSTSSTPDLVYAGPGRLDTHRTSKGRDTGDDGAAKRPVASGPPRRRP